MRTEVVQRGIHSGATLEITVDGQTVPLLGAEDLTQLKIKNELTRLILRRGFQVSDSGNQYGLNLTYKTDRNDKLRASSFSSSSNASQMWTGSSSGAGATTGLGIAVARVVGAMSATSATRSSSFIGEEISYTHTVAIEITEPGHGLIWKGEAVWESPELDILRRITPSLQVVLSELPSNSKTVPEVSEVKLSHAPNYYKLECEDTWFSCPALPYWIELRQVGDYPGEVSQCFRDSAAMAAFVDLIQTAEFAVPQGNRRDLRDPLLLELWSKALLGGEYLLMPSKRKVRVLVRLEAHTGGYYANKCWVANDVDWADFQSQLANWKKSLQEYYDVFVN